MSFILDALKKSESDRQRKSGPALFEVRVAPPRTRLPMWAIAIALLLVVNLGIVMWMLLRHPTHGSSTDAATASTPGGVAGAAVPTPQPMAAAATAPAPTAAGSAVPTVATSAPAASGAAPAALSATPPAAPPGAAPPVAATGAAATAANSATESPNAEDYAPAEEQQPGVGLGSHVRRGTASGVPLYSELATTPGTQLPQLRLDLHVFAGRPEDRFVMINMHKLREGDTLPEGARLDSITPEGAVLSFHGSKFLLPRD